METLSIRRDSQRVRRVLVGAVGGESGERRTGLNANDGPFLSAAS